MDGRRQQFEARAAGDTIAIEGPGGVVASLPVDDAISLARNILHLAEGPIAPEETYQKDLG